VVDQSEANHGARPCAAGWQGLPPLSSFKKCRVQFEFCHIDSRNLSGVSNSLILAQSPFYRRIAATAEGSEESGKRGLHAWRARVTRPLPLNGPLRGVFCPGPSGAFRASGTMAGPYHVTVEPLLEISSVPVTGFHGRILRP
jgi:hypothetical protein